MLYRLRRSESVESNFQSVSEVVIMVSVFTCIKSYSYLFFLNQFVPGSDSSSLVIYTTVSNMFSIHESFKCPVN